MALGILDLVGLGASLLFAIPLAGYGLGRLSDGDPLVGAAFVAVAALMVYLPQRLTTPGDIPGKIAERTVGSAVTTPDGEEEPVERSDSE
ncbi:DUF7533 family protein [Candidatus Halobonum tyrrellensis]|uniref:Uncharacterized protein n=1 Tax=Candidatus Halobonum tyrrellensis G22 TaxID=1324957 RepID=V4HID6_9EURY|nr:hypothetical protein [Candidatus Halobonum tyrrellensis]ESP87684.1 hypothetical protein K933_12725 [Candidatus Halobonum tyrrellensis G22]